MAGLVAWYNKAALSAAMGRTTNLASMLRCMAVPAMNFSGYSQAIITNPSRMLMIWRKGKGFTAPSRFLVRKSKKILGQKKPSTAARI